MKEAFEHAVKWQAEEKIRAIALCGGINGTSKYVTDYLLTTRKQMVNQVRWFVT